MASNCFVRNIIRNIVNSSFKHNELYDLHWYLQNIFLMRMHLLTVRIHLSIRKNCWILFLLLKKYIENTATFFQVDSLCSLYNSGGKIYEDYDCMLNQTNIGNNNNKYYVIQLIEKNGSYYFWTRWGRVVRSHYTNIVTHLDTLYAVLPFVFS